MSNTTDSDANNHDPAAPNDPARQEQEIAPAEGQWEDSATVDDNEASEEAYEPEDLPERQINVDLYLPQEEIDDNFDLAPASPEYTKEQLSFQKRLIELRAQEKAPSVRRSRFLLQLPIDSWEYTPPEPALTKEQLEFQQRFIEACKNEEPSNIINEYRDQQGFPPQISESVKTVLLSQPIHFRQPPAPRNAFNSKGLPARDNPAILMDNSATQPADIPQTNPRAKRKTLSDYDRTDILCILTPTSPAAFQAVELVAATTEQHILKGLRQSSAKPSLDIALRMDTMIIDPVQGFAFGRDKMKSDLLISKGGQMRVSGRHFCIHVNANGSLMCKDTSTNGTVVDCQLLRPKNDPTDYGDSISLHNGTVIEVMVGAAPNAESMRFMVQVPDRSGVSLQYGSKLDQYIDFVEQLKRRQKEEQKRKEHGDHTGILLPPMPPFHHVLKADKLSTRANKVLVAGTEPYNHGMQWNGDDTYCVTMHIGKGAFASVYKLTRRADGELFAAKEIKKSAFAQRGVVDRRVDQELNIMKSLEHPNIVQYIGHHETPEYLYILMELVPQGDLQSVLQTQHVLSEFQCQAVASQICGALKYLHERDITHRDIKPDNILIQSNSPYVFKLSDFGLSKMVKDETFLTSFCGTYLYCAPEVYPGYAEYNRGKSKPAQKRRRAKDNSSKPTAKKPYTSAVDTWSIAAVLYHLLCGHAPFTGTTENLGATILENIMSTVISYSKLEAVGVSQDAIDFLNKMLVIEPSMRMSDVACLSHPWIVTETKHKEHTQDTEWTAQVGAELEEHKTRDTERAEEDEVFAFQVQSQLSINNKPHEQDSVDLEMLPPEDLKDIEEMVEDMGQPQQRRPSREDLAETFDPSFGDYVDHYPTHSQVQAIQQRQGNELMFGQIPPEALRSSGVLGRETRRALGIPSQDHRQNTTDESHYEGSSQISTTDYPTAQIQPAPAPSHYHIDSGEAAPSLLGAEALVDQLHMDSPMPDVSLADTDKQTSMAKTEGIHEQGPRAGAGNAQSTHSNDDLYTATRPRSSHRQDEPSTSMRASKRVKIHHEPQHEEPEAATVDSQMKDAERTAIDTADKQQVPPTATVGTEQNTSNIAATVPANQTSSPQEPSTPSSSSTTKANSGIATTATMAPISATAPIPSTVSTTATALVTAPAPPKTTAPTTPLAPPPPPGPVCYGTLKVTSDSIPFGVIALTKRVTTFGRHPACDYTWPDPLDNRVPKFAIDVAFWRRNIERSLSKTPNLRWEKDKEIKATISTRTSGAIFVNGIMLEKGSGGLWYGVLKTGDLVCVFNGGKEKLEFMVEIKIGKSRGVRKQGEVFEVVKMDDKGPSAASSHSEDQGVQSGSRNPSHDAAQAPAAPTAS
ncbi:MAG: hypothetical protein Q9166_003619 [cf. Caloplaca sp. 2 TL-2023]